jgi:radical SAM protein with 4Fe4S-binding SPASM domain
MGVYVVDERHRVPRLDFELTSSCDHGCGHCYNVWGADEGDAQGGYPKAPQLRTDSYLRMMEKAIGQSGAQHVVITGGEPLLRKDAIEVIETAARLAKTVQLITNGSHVTPEIARRLAAAGVQSVQLTLLSADRVRHDALKGAVCFDDTVRAAAELVANGVAVQCCFVAMAENHGDFEDVMALCYALGIRFITYNRMSPTGGAIHHIAQLMPEVAHLEANLDVAERLGPKWGIKVHTGMPIPPCLIRMERYRWVQFGLCSVGTDSPNIAIDALGNVRSCNLSANILGNVVRQDWPEIHAAAYLHTFKKQVPEMCRGCRYETSCQGGCKESGFATFGSLQHPEPLLHLALNPGWRDDAEQTTPQRREEIPA